MGNQKLLNILLVALVALLLANLFFAPDARETDIPANALTLDASSREYTIPELPTVNITNTTGESVAIDVCDDLAIELDGRTLSELPEDFCIELAITAESQATIPFEPLAPLFEREGVFTLKLETGDQFSAATFSTEPAGSIHAFFRTILYAPIYNAFVFLIDLFPNHSLGLAIIAVTIVIRIVLLVPQHQMLVNARRMQTVQPKIQELRERYADDQAKLGMELIELYKREKINPVGSCLPLIIQMPILIILYSVILHIDSPTNAYFLYPTLSDFDTTSINTEFLGLDLAGIGGTGAIVLGLLVGVLQWLQIYFSLPSTPASEEQQKAKEKDNDASSNDSASMMPDPALMSRAMLWGLPPVIAVSVSFFPLGVGVYWLVNTIFMIMQQLVVNLRDRAKPLPAGVEIVETQ